MNELYFEGYGYFKTNEKNADKALDKMMEILSKEGFEFIFEDFELRNENGEKIKD